MDKKTDSFLKNNQSYIKQNTFIFLIIITSFLFCGFLFCLWFIPTIGFSSIHRYLPFVVASIIGTSIIFILWGMVGLVIQIYTGKVLFGTLFFRRFMLKGLFPFIEIVFRLLNISLKNIRRSFIETNNRLIDIKCLYNAKDVLVLVPHCIQANRCKLRLTYNSDNCVRCGKCTIGDLLGLRDKWGVQLATATGGTMARNIIKKIQPKFIVGAACERDLVSGLQDAHALPVVGVLNDCSNGACMDTSVDVHKIEAILEQVVDRSSTEISSQGSMPHKEFFQSGIPKYKDIV